MQVRQIIILSTLTLAFMASVYGLLWTTDHHVDYFVIILLAVASTVLLLLILRTFFRYMRQAQGDHIRLDD